MTRIKIKGMTCQHCVAAVTKALSRIDGITDVRVDLEKGEAAYEATKPVDMAQWNDLSGINENECMMPHRNTCHI